MTSTDDYPMIGCLFQVQQHRPAHSPLRHCFTKLLCKKRVLWPWGASHPTSSHRGSIRNPVIQMLDPLELAIDPWTMDINNQLYIYIWCRITQAIRTLVRAHWCSTTEWCSHIFPKGLVRAEVFKPTWCDVWNLLWRCPRKVCVCFISWDSYCNCGRGLATDGAEYEKLLRNFWETWGNVGMSCDSHTECHLVRVFFM